MSAGDTVLGAPSESTPPGYGAVTLSGGIAGVIGAGATFVVALPFWPRGDDQGWAELGWAIFTLIACCTVGIAAGAVGIIRALRRLHAPDAGLTAVVFIPTAALLLVGGPLVFAAPAAARWMTLGLRQWWDVAAARRRAATLPAPQAGRPQRIVLWVVLSFLGMSLSTSMFNASLGREVGGTAKVWALCAVVPLALLPLIWRALPRPALAAALVCALLVGAAMARTVTAGLQPSPERFAQIAREVQPPEGQRIGSRTSAFAERYPEVARGDPQPVEMIESVAPGKERSPLPPALIPEPDGLSAAAEWERVLRADGWTSLPSDSGGAPQSMDWLPDPADQLLREHGGTLLGRGLWLRAVVVPHGDGALVVLSTRP